MSPCWRHASALLLALAPLTAQPAAADPNLQPALLEVLVNGQASEEILILRDAGGEVYVELTTLQSWRLTSLPAEAVEIDGKQYVALSRIRGLSFRIDEGRQVMTVELDPGRMEATVLDPRRSDPGPMTPSGWGGFVNYELLAEITDGSPALNGAFEAVVFSPLGTGSNTFVGRVSDSGFDVTRLETNWTVDDPEAMRSLRIGDSITRGGIGGGPVRFGGIQVARNFAVDPGFLTLPLPSLRGSAALPSVIDVYVNNVLQQRRQVQPGPFQVVDVPVVTGSGQVQVIVRDLLGRESIIRESYYATSQLLRAGLHDYSYEVGFLRQGFGRASNDYGAMFVAGTQRLGLSNRLTGEAHVEATGGVQTAGVGATWLWPALGIFNLGAAFSRSDRGGGALLDIAFERRTPGFSFGFGAELATEEFMSIGYGPDEARPSSTIHAFAGVPLGFGSVGLSYIRRDERDSPATELLSATTSIRLGGLGSLHLSARQRFGKDSETAAELLLAVPLGGRIHANAGIATRNGGTLLSGTLQQSLPYGEGIGYRLAGTTGSIDRLEGRFDVQLDVARLGLELTWTQGRAGARFVADGSIGLVGDHAFAARRLGESFGIVRVGSHPDVRIYADNQLVGRTDSNGVAVVPQLRPYERNLIRLEIDDLPLDTDVSLREQPVRPHRRSGVVVDFPAEAARGASVTVRMEDGTLLPPGSVLRLEGGSEEFVSGPGGEVYLHGLKPSTEVLVEYGAGTCRFQLNMPQTSDPQPHLGNVLCNSGAAGHAD